MKIKNKNLFSRFFPCMKINEYKTKILIILLFYNMLLLKEISGQKYNQELL